MLYFGFFSTHIPYVIIAITYIAIFSALRFQNIAMDSDASDFALECSIYANNQVEYNKQCTTFIHYNSNDICWGKLPIMVCNTERPPNIPPPGIELSRLTSSVSNRPPPLMLC
ncbi:MAG: hypothetical protein MI922_04655 [Bacteroidales bacterium]|nr:hypothetical protein [Bacteroidales bacterium]